MPKLTKGYIDRIKPGSKDELHWDTEVRGFGLRVTPAGRFTFIVQSRIGASEKTVRITVGTYGTWTPDQAREVAKEHLRSMRLGTDPRAARKAEEALRVTLQQVADAYVARPQKLKSSSQDAILRHVRTTFEDWANEPIANITEDMCRKRYRKILTEGLRGDRENGSPGQASQGFAILGALLAYAGRQHRRADGSPICTRAPVDSLKDDRVRLKPRTNRIPDMKVGAVWLTLKELRATTYNRDYASSIDLVRLLILTGLRITEAASLRWNEVNLDDAWFHLPNPKNGNPVKLPLSTQAVEILRARPRIKGPGSPGIAPGGFVFPSWSASGFLRDPRDVMKRVSEIAGGHLTPHDLRRTYINTGLRCCRIEKFRIDLLTNHLTSDVTVTHYFDTTNLQWLAPEAQMIADWIEQQGLIAGSENVTRLATRAEAA